MADRDMRKDSGAFPGADPAAVEDLARHALERLATRAPHTDTSPEFLDRFITTLSSRNTEDAKAILQAMTYRKAGYAAIADGLLAATARRLGEKWDSDEMSFAEVAAAITQIFRIHQTFRPRQRPLSRIKGWPLSIFATLPGQSHNLGLVMAAEAFRQARWQVEVLLDTPGKMIMEEVRRRRPDAVGLSISVHDKAHQIEYLIRELNGLPTSFPILLGGSAADELADTLPPHLGVTAVHDIEEALRLVRPRSGS